MYYNNESTSQAFALSSPLRLALDRDVFPSTEAFISDQSGAKLFLGARKETGGVGDLFGDNKKFLFTVDMQIKFDKKGNFTGVQQGDKLIKPADWNKQVESQFK